MVAYISLIISGLLGVLGIFLKTTKEAVGIKGENFKTVTPAGWVVLLIMFIAFAFSLIAQHNKDISTELAVIKSKEKDSLNTLRIQQLIQKSKEDSENAKIQREYLLNLLQSSHQLDTAQRVAMKNSNELNTFLKVELKSQKEQTNRLLNPLEVFRVSYILSIPANQPSALKYRERILKLEPLQQELLFGDTSRLPNSYNPDEEEFAYFMTGIWNTISFSKLAKNDLSRASLIVEADTLVSKEDFENVIKKVEQPRYILSYDKKSDEFVISITILNPKQTSREDMLSLTDISEKNIFCEIRNGSPIINYKLKFLSLKTQNGRTLEINKFRQRKEDGKPIVFYTKLGQVRFH